MTDAWKDVARVPMQMLRGCVVASVQVQLGEEILHTFQQDLLRTVRDQRARAVIMDLSGVGILDSSDFESILRTLKMASLLGAVPLIVGIRPGIAASLAELDVASGDIAACMTLEQAFDLVERSEGDRGRDVV